VGMRVSLQHFNVKTMIEIEGIIVVILAESLPPFLPTQLVTIAALLRLLSHVPTLSSNN
jgi:hypothetical protein